MQQLTDAYDVVVVGGGPAGICAAVQAARAGASTLLVEKNGTLGGTTTVAAVNFPGLFHARGRQVIAGVGWDLVRRTVEMVAPTSMPDFSEDYGEAHYRHQVPISKGIYAALADRAVVDSGATLLLHAMIAEAAPADDGWRLTLCCKEGLCEIDAAAVVDCTGDANVFAVAGLVTERNEVQQPGTLVCTCGGYNHDALDYELIEANARAEVAAGRLKRSDFGWAGSLARSFLHSYGGNRMHVEHPDASTSLGRTEAELEARRILLRLFRFFRTQPGLENFHYTFVATECGIRETRTIVGRARVTVDDYASGRLWPDAVCYSFYPIDVHIAGERGLDKRMLPEGVLPTIPRAAMLPTGVRGIIAAGRCICADKEAHSALRVQASCMAMGQAAGAMAALAARDGCDVEEIPMNAIRALLRKHDAIVPGDA